MNKIESLTTVKLSPDVISKILRDLRSPVEIMLNSTRSYSDRLTSLFPSFGKSIMEPTLAELVSGKITPEEACKQMNPASKPSGTTPSSTSPQAMGVPEI